MPVPPDRHHFAFRTLLPALLALAVWPLWAVDLLPLPQYAQHLRVATILHDWHALPLYRQTFERLPFPTPYSGFAWLTHGLARLHDVEWAGRVVLTLSVLGLVLAARWLLSVAGHSRWLLLGVLPWALNPDLIRGDANLVLALPLFLAVLASHLWLLKQASPWRALALAVLLCMLAVSHWIWLLAVLMLPLLATWQGAHRGWRQALLWPVQTLLLILPSVALLMPWARMTWREAVLAHGGTQNLLAGMPKMPLDSGRHLIDRLFDVFAPHGAGLDSVADLFLHRPGEIASFLWLTGLSMWLLGAIRQHRQRVMEQTELPNLQQVDGTAYLCQTLVLVAVAYLLAPTLVLSPIQLAGMGDRLVNLLAILAVLALPLQPMLPPLTARKRTWLGTTAMLVVCAQLPLSTLEAFTMARTELGPLRQVHASIPVGASVAILRTRTQGKWLRVPQFANLGAWFDVMVGGYVAEGLDDPQLQPVRFRPGQQRPQPPLDPAEFRWRDHGRWYGWFVVYAPPGTTQPEWDTFLRTLPRVYQRGAWSVYQNLDVTPWPPPPELTPAEHRAATRLTECALGLQGWRLSRPLALEPDSADQWLRTLWKCPDPIELKLPARPTGDVLH